MRRRVAPCRRGLRSRVGTAVWRLRERLARRRKVAAGALMPGRRRRGDEGGGAGVREPRRPLPTLGAGAAPLPSDEAVAP